MPAKSTRPKSATSYKDTALGILSRLQVVALEKEGVKKGLEYILKLSQNKTQISPQVVSDLYRVGFGFIFPDWAGKFRTIKVEVGLHNPPHSSRIRELIKNLCDDLAERLKHLPQPESQEKFLSETISLLAWFQHRFVWVHPFKDYNGRSARLLTNLILLNLNLPVLEIQAETGKDRQHYVKAMEMADKLNLSELEGLIAKALRESLEKI